MALLVPFSPEAQAKLTAKAAAAGVDVTTFAVKTLERAAFRPSLDEVLAPLRQEFEESGMTEDELTDLLEQAKHQQELWLQGQTSNFSQHVRRHEESYVTIDYRLPTCVGRSAGAEHSLKEDIAVEDGGPAGAHDALLERRSALVWCLACSKRSVSSSSVIALSSNSLRSGASTSYQADGGLVQRLARRKCSLRRQVAPWP